MDKTLKGEQQETKLRNIVHNMVQPIIELAKKNIDHNAKKNEKFSDVNLRCDNIQRETLIL